LEVAGLVRLAVVHQLPGGRVAPDRREEPDRVGLGGHAAVLSAPDGRDGGGDREHLRLLAERRALLGERLAGRDRELLLLPLLALESGRDGALKELGRSAGLLRDRAGER